VGSDPTLFITNGDQEKLKEKAVYFVKNFPITKDAVKHKVNMAESCDNEIIFGEISPKCLIQLDKMIQYTYEPMIKNMSTQDWGQCEEEIKEEYLIYVRKFASEVQDSIQSMSPGQELFQLDPEEQQKLSHQTADADKVPFFERKFT